MDTSYPVKPSTVREREVPSSLRVERRVRNVRREDGRLLRRRLTEKLTNREITLAIMATVSATPAKVIAEATGGSIRAAQNIREGLNAMSLTGFINACRDIPELRALAMEMMGCEAETDPDFVRGVSLLLNSYMRKQDTTGNSECRSLGSAPTT